MNEPDQAPALSWEQRDEHSPCAGFGRWRLLALYSVIALLHLIGWGLYRSASDHAALVGLGLAAYLLGLRHAFDADHIAAVDDTVRFMLHRERQPLAVGFFFALGHSSVVLGAALLATFAANAFGQHALLLRSYGEVVGTSVSAAFLLLIGLMNLYVLTGLIKLLRGKRQVELHTLLQKRGLLSYLARGRRARLIQHSWQMFPLGLIFGLGLDTAVSIIGLLTLATLTAAGALSVPAVLSLPLLFTAGMTLVDTTDGVLMSHAYRWTRTDPIRQLCYNMFITALSVAVALTIGSIEMLQVLAKLRASKEDWLSAVADIKLEPLGYAITGVLLAAWLGAWLRFRLPTRNRHVASKVRKLRYFMR